ncbi:hypothetical protein JCM11641_001915 [Rhodosporidiobolus odoratus]
MVSRPSSPTHQSPPPPSTSTLPPSISQTRLAPQDSNAGASFGRHDSPLPPITTLKHTPSETITALAPSAATNTASGLGRPGQEQLAHLNAPETLFGGAQGVVGAAKGAAPEYIARVKKVDGGPATAGEEEHVKREIEGAIPSHGAGDALAVPGEQDDDASSVHSVQTKQPKWFRKVKESASSAASSIKEKAKDVASSTHSASPTRSRAGSTASSLAPASDMELGRSRSRSIGIKNSVAFSGLDDNDATPLAQPTSLRTSLDNPRGVPTIITDRDGHPVPVEVGATTAGTPTSSTPEGLVPPPGVAGGNASMTTSVRDKIAEEGYEVEPATTQEKFHSIFKEIPQEEELIEDYRCALVRDILVQGKLYVSETYLSFRANILGWETTLQLPWTEIVSIEKRMTAKIIPNAIEVRSLHATHTFSSFVARDASYSLIVAIWRHCHPEADKLIKEKRDEEKAERRRARALSTGSSAKSTAADTDDEDADAKSEISFEDETGAKKRHRFKLPRGKVSAAIRSIKGRDTAADEGTTSTPAVPGGPTEAEKVKASALAAANGDGEVHPPTHYDGPEYKNEALDMVFPTSVWKMYQLFFRNTEFLHTFMEEKEGLKEIDIGPWRALSGAQAEDDDQHALKQRDMSYLKPLNAPVGPKQTHCHIHDENEKLDSDACVVNLTRTKTPDVPSGDGFSVVTRTVFTWAEGGGCRVRVTTEVEWTKVNRFLKGVIERGAIDGQKQYHKDLEAAVRAHITANPAEYGVKGVASTPSEPESATPASASTTQSTPAQQDDSFVDSLGVPVDYLVAALGSIVIFLFLSNLYFMFSRSSAPPTRLGQPQEVASAVSRVLGEFNALHARRLEGISGEGAVGELGELKALVQGLERTLEGTARELALAVKTVREVVDRTEGVRAVL